MKSIQLKYPTLNPVFFIGASAGGVKALMKLAEDLPEDFSAPLFFILHRRLQNEEQKYLLPDILQNKTSLKIVVPSGGEVINAGHIYIPPQNKHLIIQDNQITVSDEPSDSHWRPSIDVTMKSGAREYTQHTVSILLTGGMDDGIQGLIETTHQGGITIAQSPDDAYDPILPLNALIKDHPAYVLPLDDMAALLCELSGYEGFRDDQQDVAIKAAVAAATKKEQLKHAEVSPRALAHSQDNGLSPSA